MVVQHEHGGVHPFAVVGIDLSCVQHVGVVRPPPDKLQLPGDDMV